MKENLSPTQLLSLDFYDGYVYKFLQDTAAGGDDRETGLYNYYRGRFDNRRGGLTEQEGALVDYLLSAFPPDTVFVHAGIGAGTVAGAIAAMGRSITGIEGDPLRLKLAARLRQSLSAVWPEVAARYTLVEGYFPEVLAQVPTGAGAVLFFTNFFATLPPARAAQIVASLSAFAHVIVELRTFMTMQETAAERDAMLARLLASGLSDEGPVIAEVAGCYFRRLQPRGNLKTREAAN